MTKPKAAFIRVHNPCRSQITRVLSETLASDVFESYSTEIETEPQIDQDAVWLMRKLYGIDVEQTQYSRMISTTPEPNFVIPMRCNTEYPFTDGPFDDNWRSGDPTEKDDAVSKDVIMQIHRNIITLKNCLQAI